MGDNFGHNHEARRAWRNGLFLKYGENPLRSLIYDSNQFRANAMVTARLRIGLLANYARQNGKPELAERLDAIAAELISKLTGEDLKTHQRVNRPYDEIDDLNEKLAVVHFHEDKIIEALQLLSQM